MPSDVFDAFKPDISALREGIDFSRIGREFFSLLESCQKHLDTNDSNGVVNCAQLITDLVWEQLHTGHWKDVNINWRFLYRAASYLKSWGNLMKSCEAESLRVS